MGKIRRVPRCYHCGMVLQCTNPHEKGYVSPEILNRDVPVQIIYCNECYNNLISLNEDACQNTNEDILKILDDAVATDALVFWVIDLFSFNGILNKEIAKKIKHLKVSVILSKRNLFSKMFDEKFTKDFVNNCFESYGIKPIDIRYFSNNDKNGAKELFEYMNKERAGHDVYMVGNHLCGKTSIINRMLKYYVNKTRRNINSYTYKGTESTVLEIPLDRSASFYELPGIETSNSLGMNIEKDIWKMINPKKEVKVSQKILTTGECVMVGSLAILEIVKGKPTTFKFNSSENVEVKKVLAKYVQKSFIENYSTKAVRPVSNRYSTFRDYDLYEFKMENDNKLHDISIDGLGWFSFTARGQIIRLTSPKRAAVNETLAKVKQ